MAKIGLNNFRYFILTEAQDGTPTYAEGKKPGKAVSCSVEIETSDASLYADDALAEYDGGFAGGTVTMTIDDDDIETLGELLGHTVTQGEMVRTTEDAAPYVGLGRVVTKMVNGAYKYVVEFLSKVKFNEPSQDNETKGEDLDFGTTEIEGTIAALANGTWSTAKSFDTKAAAITYLESLGG